MSLMTYADFLEQIKDGLKSGDFKPNDFILVSKDEEGNGFVGFDTAYPLGIHRGAIKQRGHRFEWIEPEDIDSPQGSAVVLFPIHRVDV